MKKLYTISFAKTAEDTPRTGTLFYSQYTCLADEDNDWIKTDEKSVSKLTRDEQIAHIDTLIPLIGIPGEQESDVGMSFDKFTAVPLTNRIAIGLTENVKELHTLELSPEGDVREAAMNSADERRFVQKDFIAIVERLFKDIRKYDSSQDIYSIQKNLAKKTIRRKNGKLPEPAITKE
jgi:hypothetical protein